jgi:ABC-type proline/glycine betaine transport system permease subunit
MRRDELMKGDLVSEILLVGSGVAILLALAMVVVAALASAPAL